MSLSEQLTDYVNAAFTGLWVLTREPDEARRELLVLARDRSWKVATRDIAAGLHLPSRAEKDVIWALYRRQFRVPQDQARPDDTDWTGAEIRSCCRLAALLGVPLAKAAEHVVPVAVTAAEQVDKLRSWADGRCLAASPGGIYRRAAGPTAAPVRRVRRNPENN
jgi:hypothetical protein